MSLHTPTGRTGRGASLVPREPVTARVPVTVTSCSRKWSQTTNHEMHPSLPPSCALALRAWSPNTVRNRCLWGVGGQNSRKQLVLHCLHQLIGPFTVNFMFITRDILHPRSKPCKFNDSFSLNANIRLTCSGKITRLKEDHYTICCTFLKLQPLKPALFANCGFDIFQLLYKYILSTCWNVAMGMMPKVFNGLNSNLSKSRNILLTAYYKVLYFIWIYALGNVLDKPRFGVRIWIRGTGPHGGWETANRAESPTPCKGQQFWV